jgi:hypothetical protein
MDSIATVRLEIHPSEEVSTVSTVTGYISRSAEDEKIIQVLCGGFSDKSISTLRISSEQCKLLTSSGDVQEFNLDYQYVWENEKEIIIYAIKVNGGDDMIVIRGALNGSFNLSKENANIEIGDIHLSVRYERRYGWHIECTENDSIQIVDKVPPEFGISGTDMIRIGTDGSLEPINYDEGVEDATIRDFTSLLH